ncbi:hypothetical protein VVD49_03815 [Uliginosibacterium sp. H3]|uniref:Lipoprotein n=1 Tax=Uliginosibacterium silvisoli TaxID=3114758 RepID=A0ABU6K085_9RHOO|nr:hypothetical protein [Uliginosibacterium sp. H3]
MHEFLARAKPLTTALLLCLSACSSTPEPVKPVEPVAAPAVASKEVPIATVITPPPGSGQDVAGRPAGVAGVRSRLLGGKTISLPPTRPLEVNSRCNFANETGYKGDAVIEIKAGVVRQMRVLVDIPDPNKGRCIFEMSGMVQTKSTPSVELVNRATGCTARMWEQGETAVVSFSQCHTSCTSAESFKYVWPVLIHRKANKCD